MAASGSGTASPFGTAALEMAASRWSRALATAQASHPSIDPPLLATIGRALCRSGEIVFDLAVDPARGLTFIPASDWLVFRGGADPSTWEYQLSLRGPGTQAVVNRTRAGVAHFVYASDPRRPWKGLSPLQWATSTGSLMAPCRGGASRRGFRAEGQHYPIARRRELEAGTQDRLRFSRGKDRVSTDDGRRRLVIGVRLLNVTGVSSGVGAKSSGGTSRVASSR